MKLLITGSNGQIAWDLIKTAKRRRLHCVALTREQLDITRPDHIAKALSLFKPSIIVNTAAYTDVDNAEQEQELASQINRDGAGLLAQHCAKSKIPLIHLSTDYVFNGKKSRPYFETDRTRPINFYGKSKYQGEQLIRKYLDEHIILRTSGIFGVHHNNFVKTMIQLGKNNAELRVVDDQITCPTYAADIAETIIKIAESIQIRPTWGIYHYCSSETTSWYGFTNAIIEETQQYTPLSVNHITPIHSDEFKTIAERPKNSVLNCKKINSVFGIEQAPWRTGLKLMLVSLNKINYFHSKE